MSHLIEYTKKEIIVTVYFIIVEYSLLPQILIIASTRDIFLLIIFLVFDNINMIFSLRILFKATKEGELFHVTK